MLLVAACFSAHRADACSAANPASFTPVALPKAGSTEVPTATSFVVEWGAPLSQLALDADGVAVPLDPPIVIGVGRDDVTGQPISFSRVTPTSGFLPASANLTLSGVDVPRGRVTLTTVKTAAGYDKERGTPANLKQLTLTRVRYPISLIGAGTCIFDEYVGHVTLSMDAATIPGTPADSVVSTISLSPKHGGAAGQSRTFTGGTFVGDPPGVSGRGWTPYLDPTLEYCAAITSFGVGDIARLSVVSNTVCTRVIEVAEPGAGDADAGTTTDASDGSVVADGAQEQHAADKGAASSGGCGLAPAADRPSRSAGALGVLALAAGAFRRRRAVSRGSSSRRS